MFDRLLTAIHNALERLLLLWLVILCGAVYFWSDWSGWLCEGGLTNPFAASWGILNYLIAATMLAIGSLLPKDEIRAVGRQWPLVLVGTVIQYTAMPLLGYGCGKLFGLEGPLLIGTIIVGCVPGAMASNMLTMIGNGNVSYSVGLTTSATLLSPIVVPLGLWLTLGQVIDFPVSQTFITLCWTVVLPVLAGYLLAQKSKWWEAGARRIGAIVANLVILWIIATVVAKNRTNLSRLDAQLLTALLTVNVGGYLAGYWGAWAAGMPSPMRRAVTLEVGMQNAGLGTALASQLFPTMPEIAIPCAFYTFGCMLTGTILARYWAEYDRWRGVECRPR
jgi:BASS family bile acid:Na+ symporter